VALFTDDRLEAGETVVPRDFVGESPLESIVLAARASVRRWGWDKVTMDDICAEAGVSRATLYRMFPGGRDVLFDAMREVRRREFFEKLRSKVEGADTFEEFIVRAITVASVELRDDTELATMIATTPGETLGHLTISDVPHIVSSATSFLAPLAERFVSREEAEQMLEVISRLVISVFLAPSKHFNFTDEASVRKFVHSYVPQSLLTI
jgi:AcrR family transcriptional regulator